MKCFPYSLISIIKNDINYEYDSIDVSIYVFILVVCGNSLLFRFFSIVIVSYVD